MKVTSSDSRSGTLNFSSVTSVTAKCFFERSIIVLVDSHALAGALHVAP